MATGASLARNLGTAALSFRIPAQPSCCPLASLSAASCRVKESPGQCRRHSLGRRPRPSTSRPLPTSMSRPPTFPKVGPCWAATWSTAASGWRRLPPQRCARNACRWAEQHGRQRRPARHQSADRRLCWHHSRQHRRQRPRYRRPAPGRQQDGQRQLKGSLQKGRGESQPADPGFRATVETVTSAPAGVWRVAS